MHSLWTENREPRKVLSGLTISQYNRFPVFSSKETTNFFHKFQPRTQTVSALPVISGETLYDLPITPETTCTDVFKTLASRYPSARFVVQLGDLLFRFDESAAGDQRWLDAVQSHACTVIVCQQDESKQQNILDALHKAGFANPFVLTSDEAAKKDSAYNVVFIDSAGSSSAQSLVTTYAPDAKAMEGDWICGTPPKLEGARFWAPPYNSTPDDWAALLHKLRGPVRLMVTATTQERFVNVENQELFQQLNRLFWLPAVGRVDIVFTDGPYWSRDAFRELQMSAASCANAVTGWLSGIPCQDWWTSSKEYYARLPESGRSIVNEGTSKLFASLREYHGVPLYRVIENTKTHLEDRIVCNSRAEETLLRIAGNIARALDIELLLRAVKTLNSDYAEYCEKVMLENLRAISEYLGNTHENWFFQVNRKFLENAVHRLRIIEPANTVHAAPAVSRSVRMR